MATPSSPPAGDPLLRFQEQLLSLQSQGKDLSNYEVEKTRGGKFVLKEIPKNPGFLKNLFRSSGNEHIKNIQTIAEQAERRLGTQDSGINSVILTRALSMLLNKQVRLRQGNAADDIVTLAFVSIGHLNHTASETNPAHRAINAMEQAIDALQTARQPLARVLKQLADTLSDFTPQQLERIQNLAEFQELKITLANLTTINAMEQAAIDAMKQAIDALQTARQPLARVLKQLADTLSDFTPQQLERIQNSAEFQELKMTLANLTTARSERPNPELERVTVAIAASSLPSPTRIPVVADPIEDRQYQDTTRLMQKWFSKIPNFQAVRQTFARERLESFSIVGRSLAPEQDTLQHLAQKNASQDFIQQAKIALLAEALSVEMRLRWPRESREHIEREVANLISLCPIDKNPVSDLSLELNRVGSKVAPLGEGSMLAPATATEQPTPRFIFRFHEEDTPGCSLDVQWKFNMIQNMANPDTVIPILIHSSLSKSLHDTAYRGSVSMHPSPPPPASRA